LQITHLDRALVAYEVLMVDSALQHVRDLEELLDGPASQSRGPPDAPFLVRNADGLESQHRA
jgi:hypothetical protein